MAPRRALHFVFKIGNRNETIKFYREILGMKVLRHEEFEEGCKASCNGPYDGKWSKTMIGFGPEDDHFVLELTYNYGIKEYKLGNDFQGLSVHSKTAFANATKHNYPIQEQSDNCMTVQAPDGYKFLLVNEDGKDGADAVTKVAIGVSSLANSLAYWHKLLGMTVFDQTDTKAVLGYDADKCKLELIQLEQPVDHATAFGRIAFSCPRDQLPAIEKAVKEAGHTIVTPLVSLDTPGKATVEVVILADPDGHEICFVGDEAFRELSQPDVNGDELLDKAMAEDKSDEWFKKRKKWQI
ncbi:Glyoxalase domain-containing protein 4 [Porites harrisoni]